ncbi:MAG: sensor histidine kinase [Ruminococcaceae bacterium]|nr:sensor histidine kinase [Oscillospiraceae bacterium]
MKELSLNILDITMNSVKAGASFIEILLEDVNSVLTVTIKDNGCGMSEEQINKLTDPFFTTRTTRKVGLGIPFYTLAAKQTGGDVKIFSKTAAEYPDENGTTVTAVFLEDSIDFTPLGDIISTLITLIQGYPEIDFLFKHTNGKTEVLLDTREISETLGSEIPINSVEILDWIKQFLEEQYINSNLRKD